MISNKEIFTMSNKYNRFTTKWITVKAYVVFILIIAFLNGCKENTGIDSDHQREFLLQTQNEFLTAISSKQIEQTIEHFTDDAIAHIANMPPIQGRDAIRQLFDNTFRFISSSVYTPERLHISKSAEMAYSTGEVKNIFEGEQGQMEYPGKYLFVWEKREDSWLMVVYSISSNQSETGR